MCYYHHVAEFEPPRQMLFVRRTRRGSGGIADLQASLDRSCLGMCCAESWGAAGEGEQLLLFLDNEC